MGYDIFRFGALYVGNEIQPIPRTPRVKGDVPKYNGKSTITIGPASGYESITWIKPDNLNLLIADRVLLVKVSWEDLDKNGFVKGKLIPVNGQYFRCRLLQVGGEKNVSNEWDKALDEIGEDNAFWHWDKMYFLGVDAWAHAASFRMVRGYYSARTQDVFYPQKRYVNFGFRPALEPLPSDAPILNINLDGIDFQLTNLPEGDGFCPILQPVRGDVFKDIPIESKVRMYTFVKNGCPIHFGTEVEDVSKLTLTDRYFGDEYLVPWTISNGIAVVSQSLKQQT